MLPPLLLRLRQPTPWKKEASLLSLL